MSREDFCGDWRMRFPAMFRRLWCGTISVITMIIFVPSVRRDVRNLTLWMNWEIRV
mgnify:CR=1 FL=1